MTNEDIPHNTSTAGASTDDPATDDQTRTLHSVVNRHGIARFEDRTAIVTGSTRGLGEGIARRLASEGANVVVTGRTVDDGEDVVEDVRDADGEATFVRADMGDPDDIQHLIDETAERYGAIDVLVNNAAALSLGPFETRERSDWELVMDVSLRGPWLATKYALDHLPRGGRVINISSVHSIVTGPQHFPYNVAKAGLNGMTRSLAIDLGPLGITVNAILPGRVRNDDRDLGEQSRRYADLTPAGRVGMPDDIAALTAFLASDEAGFITGATVTADGGWTTCLHEKMDRYEQAGYR